MLSWIALVLFIIFATIIIYLLKLNSWRNSLEYNFTLHPNCLLTQHPLLILTGKTSLFYKGRYWNCVPDWLESHGYEVLEFSFSSNSDAIRKKELLEFLNLSHNIKFHILSDDSNFSWIQTLDHQKLNSVKSMTVCGNQLELKNTPEIQVLKLNESNVSKRSSTWKTTVYFHKFITNTKLNGPSLCLPNYENNNFLVRNYLLWAISLAEKDMS